MAKQIFTVQNVKCGGCANTIEEGLKALDGVQDVAVEVASGQVSVTGEGLARAVLADKLADLGYPEV